MKSIGIAQMIISKRQPANDLEKMIKNELMKVKVESSNDAKSSINLQSYDDILKLYKVFEYMCLCSDTIHAPEIKYMFDYFSQDKFNIDVINLGGWDELESQMKSPNKTNKTNKTIKKYAYVITGGIIIGGLILGICHHRSPSYFKIPIPVWLSKIIN